MERKVIDTADGSKTLFIPEMDEQYHSVNGAITESNHVFLNAGYNHHQSTTPVVFEVGFGTGLNALLTAIAAENQKRQTTFISIEKFPLDQKLIHQLNYGKLISEQAELLFKEIHAANWGVKVQISDFFTLLKTEGDLTNFRFEETQKFDIIYFDAFGPDKQPDMWNPVIFNKIYNVSAEDAVFVTYSAKGQIRRQLRDCGYSMERLPGPPGKRQMLRGTKISKKND
ncbi:tRNA (5-methylaminomethyl-2-thiouridine)(34)-methyltransferase MnmD [Prolixibacteraceae bacterium Z1-6]|uniref:tRNA (5-methylaminomethyl-2-thiouridine)(34)-methyltransferase MnmD n=1 Tax=Draconibacterium aestuarii TaxID=2998507 RepID=A0A9X3J5R7_9BACT|nr:tRNA (5-methylaminomethyl-2-thiouridine)(34)-methyltransferase MnmD [Prolixibacteraceae bacterium Z1-6]